jgi:hypothetical protein
MKIQVVTATGEKKNYFINWAYKHKTKTVETYCNVFIDRELFSKGKTYVHKGDVFDKKFGRKVALGKALIAVMDKNERTQIWDAYRKMVNEVKVNNTNVVK